MKYAAAIALMAGCLVSSPGEIIYTQYRPNGPLVCHPQHEDVWFCTDDHELQYYWNCSIKYGRWQCRLVWR